jgi:pSer/pThr/pTyr-binding forkhead associated (FHA) protein
LDISLKFCPICKNKNDRDAIICVHCGAPLESYGSDSPTTRNTELPTIVGEKIGAFRLDDAKIPTGQIAVYVEGSSKPIFSTADKEFVIGRKVSEISDVSLDLAALGGYHLGLSRRHAAIRRTDHEYEVIDLASSNGTWLNNERLTPNKPYRLTSGSQLRLARMNLLIVYRPEVEAKHKT